MRIDILICMDCDKKMLVRNTITMKTGLNSVTYRDCYCPDCGATLKSKEVILPDDKMDEWKNAVYFRNYIKYAK